MEVKKEAGILYNELSQLSQNHLFFWSQEILFSWHWWISVALSLLPWLLWWFFRPRESTMRLLTVGFFIMLLSTVLDLVGLACGFWYYPYQVTPFFHGFLPWNNTLMPVTVMLLLLVPRFSLLSKAVTFGLLTSFVGEPLFIWMGLYVQLGWHHFYSLPIYTMLYILSHLIFHATSFKRPAPCLRKQ
ncbi:CBO0543 family protein [Virgibacillus xinjiangensis]|uniref:CBO0543 family protein n=1 Tax=Virgibacillus xinjiangensis TaxID=393090 RepID=A0ABV7CQN9_9BACI